MHTNSNPLTENEELDELFDKFVWSETTDWDDRKEFKAAIEALIERRVVEAIRVHDVEEAIERLDIQCSEGKCKNCDSKRPLLNQLQAHLSNKEKQE